MKDYLKSLNPQQREAVESTEGFVRVIAGAGSGKTRVITTRYIHLVEEYGVSSSSILLVTFTRKAANEMYRRVREKLGDMASGYITTFHGLCVRILKQDGSHVGCPKTMMILDQWRTREKMRSVLDELGLDHKTTTVTKALHMVSHFMHSQGPHIQGYYEIMTSTDPEYLERKKNWVHSLDDTNDQIFYLYILKKREETAYDYDDLMFMAMHLFDHFRDIEEKWQRKFAYIMVDEFQDVSEMQYELAGRLSGIHHNLMVVGDPDQTIYTWRGADVRFILNFDQAFVPCKSITMEQNYRSKPAILHAANELIKHNYDRLEKNLFTDSTEEGGTYYCHLDTDNEQYKWIAEKIKELHEQQGICYSDIAILYRANDLSRRLGETLPKYEIPYVILAGDKFYEREEVLDFFAYLQLCVSDNDESLFRILNRPKRGIGKKTKDRIKEYARAHKCGSCYKALKEILQDYDADVFPVNSKARRAAKKFVDAIEDIRSRPQEDLPTTIQDLLDESGYQAYCVQDGDKDNSLAILKQMVETFALEQDEPVTINDFLCETAVYLDDDLEGKDAVKLMTMHGAKGLEFKVVFVSNFSAGITPSANADDFASQEEERRLAYVAFTRAMETLYVVDSENPGGKRPSQFLCQAGEEESFEYIFDLPEHLKWTDIDRKRLHHPYTDPDFHEGDRVVHSAWGKGTIVSLTPTKYVIQFDDIKTERTLDPIINDQLRKLDEEETTASD